MRILTAKKLILSITDTQNIFRYTYLNRRFTLQVIGSRYKSTMCPKKFIYPVARRDDDVVDDYHGTEVPDPYRWLEDPESEETSTFVDAQNYLTRSYLDTYSGRAGIHKRLTHLANYTKFYAPMKVGDTYVFCKNTGLQNQCDLYFQEKPGESRIFLDINGMSVDGSISLGSYRFSEDNSILAYTLSESGSDWYTIRFRDVTTGEDLPDVLQDVKFTCLSWSHNNEGLFYCRYLDVEDVTGTATAKDPAQKLFYHLLGTQQEDDLQVVAMEEFPQARLGGTEVTHCGNYLLVMLSMQNNLVHFVDLTEEIQENMEIKAIITELDSQYKYVTNRGPDFYFLTNKNALNYRIVKININEPEEDKWEEVLAEDEENCLESAILVHTNKLLVTYIEDVKHVVQLRYLKTGELLRIFPICAGKVECATGHRNHSEIFIKLVSFLIPGEILHYDLKTMDETTFHESKLQCFDFKKYETNQVYFDSKDGTSLPMYIIKERDMVKNGSKPLLMYGYGGFNISTMPFFTVFYLVFMEHFHGAVAVVNIRGGGEYGKRWHEAGKLDKKQNCFDDFQAAAEYLIEHKYTCRQKLTISGGSNGGLLVGACINQRPDLFGLAIASVGVMDMLRYHKFTIGYAWVTEYGSSEDEIQFENLFKYSPLHNIKVPEDEKTQYPATLLLTADHDNRVVPLHSLKFIATLQNTLRDHPKQKRPLMIRVGTKSGHGAGKPTDKQIEEYTDILCFIARAIEDLSCHCPVKTSNSEDNLDLELMHDCSILD